MTAHHELPASQATSLNVLVLGMHRSGTSAVAGALIQAGLFGGPQAELEAFPRLANPSGYAEQRTVVALDDRMLDALGWRWDGIPSSPPATIAPLPELVAEGRQVMRSAFAEHAPWVVKDPRMSVLLPWWRQIVLDRVVAVVAVRPAPEVAWSLSLRDGFPAQLGTALWLAYYRHIARGLNGLPAVLVDYSALAERPEIVVPLMVSALRAFGVKAEWKVDDAIASVRTELRRATDPVDRPGPTELDRRAADAFAVLLPSGPVARYDRFGLEMPAPSEGEEAILRHHLHANASPLEGGVDQQELVVIRQRLVQSAADTDRLGAQIEVAAAQVSDARAERDRLRADLDDRERAHDALIMSTARGTTGARQIVRGVRATAGRIGARLPWFMRSHPLFDGAWYRTTYPDVRGSRLGAYAHYRRHGWREGRSPNPWFAPLWYLAAYPDVAASGLEPLDHYSRFGAHEVRNPGPGFDALRYLRDNPDVAANGLDPLLHYLRHGQAEGRQVHPVGAR